MSKKEKINLSANDARLLEKKGYKLGDPLKSGSFAYVCRATYKDTAVAAKVIDLEKTSDDYRLKVRQCHTAKLQSTHPLLSL